MSILFLCGLLYPQCQSCSNICGLYLFLLTVYEVIRYFLHIRPQPIWFGIVTVLVAISCFYRNKDEILYYRALKKGLEGEKFVGQYLENLRSQDCRVFHDLICENFNIDHIVVSPRGIFVIETKTSSKPIRGCPVVEFDGEEVLIDKQKPFRNPIEQARALRDWLSDFLFNTTGNKYPVLGVVIFPHWYIMKTGNQGRGDIAVLNHKNLAPYINKWPIVMQKEDIALVSSRITDYIRLQTTSST